MTHDDGEADVSEEEARERVKGYEKTRRFEKGSKHDLATRDDALNDPTKQGEDE